MEILQLVRARAMRWRVRETRTYDGCRLVTLDAASAATHPRVLRVLAPFDDLDPIVRPVRARRVGTARWRRGCRALIATDFPPASLACAARAHFDLLPHQLDPALAVVAGDGCRVLLADDVGLGKTVQAGLILAELIARQAVERALVLTPSGLRAQWHEELSVRFALRPAIADGKTLRERTAALPFGENPWTTISLAIASLDYVKRPEVFPAVASCAWDALVVDEAHMAVGDSERCASVRALAARASYVILLTATPHSGDERAFATLCELGDTAPPDRLLVFRRRRSAIRPGAVRRVRTLRVRPSTAERRMLHALDRYQRIVLAEHGSRALALSVLDKRALSSAWSLLQSVDRRLAWLGQSVANEQKQLSLPLTPADGEHDADDEPPAWPVELALSDAEEERRLLQAISVAARAASGGAESKLRALRRFLRRTHEAAIVFTEYRDTAEHLRNLLEREGFSRALHREDFRRSTLLLHGGLSSDERSALVDRFSRAPAAVLVATDAAGQGLNLHRACRLVVNLELPWNPMRLEQRIGRVDRIGQSRTVHAIHLVAAGTREERILARLRGRVAAARDAIDAPDPLSTSSARHRDHSRARSQSTAGGAEATRLAVARAVSTAADAELIGELETSRWWVARARGRRLRARLSGRALFIYRLSAENAAARTIASRIVPIVADADAEPDTLASLVVEPIARRWEAHVALANNRFWQQRIARERSMVAAAPAGALGLFQPALFDRRAERDQRERHAKAERSAEHLEARLAHAVLQSGFERRSCELLLVLLP